MNLLKCPDLKKRTPLLYHNTISHFAIVFGMARGRDWYVLGDCRSSFFCRYHSRRVLVNTAFTWKYDRCRISTTGICTTVQRNSFSPPQNRGVFGVFLHPQVVHSVVFTTFFLLEFFWFVRPWLQNQSPVSSSTKIILARCPGVGTN